MLFQKKPTAIVQPEPEPKLEWPDISRPGQTFWVGVTQWDYKVFPSMQGQRWGSLLFQFEGRTNLGALKGLAVVGEIEVLEPAEELRMLSDHWTNVPQHIEGYGFLMHDKNDPAHAASFGLTFYCKAEALDWVYRAFLCGLGTPNGGLGIEVNIAYPDPVAPDFWKEEWRAKWWQVTSWKLFSGVNLSRNRDK